MYKPHATTKIQNINIFTTAIYSNIRNMQKNKGNIYDEENKGRGFLFKI